MKKIFLCVLFITSLSSAQGVDNQIYALKELKTWMNPAQIAFHSKASISFLSKYDSYNGGRSRKQQILSFRGRPLKKLAWDIQLSNQHFYVEKNNQIRLGLAYAVQFDKNNSLSFGLRSKIHFYQLNLSDLKVFDDDLFLQSNLNTNYFSFDIGLQYKVKKSNLYLSLNQLNVSKLRLPVYDSSFLISSDYKPINRPFHIGFDHLFVINNSWQMRPHFWYSFNTLFNDFNQIGVDFLIGKKLTAGFNRFSTNTLMLKAILKFYSRFSFGYYHAIDNGPFVRHSNEFLLLYSF